MGSLKNIFAVHIREIPFFGYFPNISAFLGMLLLAVKCFLVRERLFC